MRPGPRSGAVALGVGTDLVNPAAISQGRPESITQKAQAYLTILQQERAARGPYVLRKPGGA
jgi:2-keto-3-deoxy-6-phosphogluconate aldolase